MTKDALQSSLQAREHGARLEWEPEGGELHQFPCVTSTRRKGQQLQEGGFNITYDFSVRIRLNAISLTDGLTIFGSTPSPEQLALPGPGDKLRILMAYADDMPGNWETLRVEFATTVEAAFMILYLADSGTHRTDLHP